jgi:acyl-CoA thioesterase-1
MGAQAQENKIDQHKVLVLGDSLSAAYNIPVEQGWVMLLADALSEHNPAYQVVNASISGETTAGGRARLAALLDQHQPDWVIIELGGNDGLRGFPLQFTENNLSEMVNQAQAADAKVLLLGMQLPPNYGVAYTEAFTEIFERVATDNEVLLVPFFLDGVGGDDSLMQADGIHPNAEAQPIMKAHVWQVLAPELN